MAAQDAEGIILRKYYLRETSYILVIFTKDFGKIRGVLKGARNPYPQFAGNFEIFTRVSVTFYRKKKSAFDLVTRCDTEDFFLPVRKDIERLTCANYFIELIDTVTTDNDVNGELYHVLGESLKLLATEASPKRVSRIFELKLLEAIGLAPELNTCAKCSSPVQPGNQFRFSAASGGLVCPGCAKRDATAIAVSTGTVNFMRRIMASPIDKLLRIKVSKEVGSQTEKALERFIAYHISRPMRSMKFYRELEKTGIV